MPTTDYIEPRNWNEFQHYSNRKPAWIKLHRSLLDDYTFARLDTASRALAPCLWLLASEYERGQIPLDFGMIAFRVHRDQEEVRNAISTLVSSGFFVSSVVLADGYQPAILEKEREKRREEKRREETQQQPAQAPAEPSRFAFACDYFRVTERLDADMATAFPWVDRQDEYRRMAAWCAANQSRRPKSQHGRFVHNWLSKVPSPKPLPAFVGEGGRGPEQPATVPGDGWLGYMERVAGKWPGWDETTRKHWLAKYSNDLGRAVDSLGDRAPAEWKTRKPVTKPATSPQAGSDRNAGTPIAGAKLALGPSPGSCDYHTPVSPQGNVARFSGGAK